MYYCSLAFQMYLMPFPSAHIAAIQCYILCRIITMSPKCPGLCFRSLAFIKQLPGFGWHGFIHQLHDNKEVKFEKSAYAQLGHIKPCCQPLSILNDYTYSTAEPVPTKLAYPKAETCRTKRYRPVPGCSISCPIELAVQ